MTVPGFSYFIRFGHRLLLAALAHRKPLLLALVAATLLFGVLGLLASGRPGGWLAGLNTLLSLFLLNPPEERNLYLEIARLLSLLVVFFSAVLLFFSRALNRWVVRSLQDQPFDLLIGLGSQNLAFLRGPAPPLATLVIEADPDHGSIPALRERGFGIITRPAEEAIDRLRLARLRHCLIATGNDRRNMALALRLARRLEQCRECHLDGSEAERADPVIRVRVDNRDLAVLFRQEVVRGAAVDMAPYSLHEIMVRALFARHGILGSQPEIIHDAGDFHIVLVGDSPLCAEVVHYLATHATLPEQNRLHLHCLSPGAEAFCARLEKQFPGIRRIPHLQLEAVPLDPERLSFYTHALWHEPRLTLVIVATGDEDANLDIVVNLQDTTYITETTSETDFRTRILFAAFDDPGLAQRIDEDQDAFANFFRFGSLAEIARRRYLMDETLDTIARLIHFDYVLSKQPNRPVDDEQLRRAWREASLNDRESCRSQAEHMDIKLLALGLKKIPSEKPLAERLEHNHALLKQRLGDFDREQLASYFPDRFDSLADKLARAEHNRWNAFHYLRGWQYDTHKDKKAKRHDCLQPLEAFDTPELKATYQYDLLAVLNMPVYLAHAGYEMTPVERK